MAAASFDLATMLTNLSASFDNIWFLCVSITFVIGFSLTVRGVMMYSILARQTMSSAQKGEIAGPLVHIVVGIILMYLPSTVDTSLITVFGKSDVSQATDLVAYQALSGIEQWNAISDVIVKYVKLVGLIAFIRGWVILSKMGHAGAQPGSMGKGLIHVIGGVLLLNIVDTFNILAETFGYTH